LAGNVYQISTTPHLFATLIQEQQEAEHPVVVYVKTVKFRKKIALIMGWVSILNNTLHVDFQRMTQNCSQKMSNLLRTPTQAQGT